MFVEDGTEVVPENLAFLLVCEHAYFPQLMLSSKRDEVMTLKWFVTIRQGGSSSCKDKANQQFEFSSIFDDMDITENILRSIQFYRKKLFTGRYVTTSQALGGFYSR